MKCDCCGIESPVEEAFSPVARVFQKPLRYCPPCAKKRDWRIIKQSLIFLVVCLILLLLMGFGLERPGRKRNELLLLPLCFVFYPLGVVLHELAHAAVAKALGLRVFNILIGFRGPTVWQRTLFGTEVRINSLPADGLTLLAPRSLQFYRLRMGATYVAGPLINASLVTGVYLLPRATSDMSLSAGALFWSNLLLVAVALFPWRHATPHGVFASDGLAILSLPFASRKSFEERHASYFALEGLQCVKKKSFQAAIEWTQRGLREYPGQLANRSVLGMAQLGLDQFAVARATFASCLENSQTKLANKAIFLVNLAWTELGREDRGNLEDADRFSAEAFKLTPWTPAIQGTRGCALVELGRLDEAIDLLTKSFEDNENALNKAVNASYLAIAFAKKGSKDESRRYLEKARKLNSDCSLLPRVQKELSTTETCV